QMAARRERRWCGAGRRAIVHRASGSRGSAAEADEGTWNPGAPHGQRIGVYRGCLQGRISRAEFLFFSLLLSRCARAANTDYDEVARAFERCGFALPEELAWPRWLADRDMAIRARLGRGEEDTLVNFVLLGVSFTAQPRVMIEALDASLIDARVRDFVSAVHSPGHNARLISLRRLLDSQTQPPELWVNELVSRRLAEQRKNGPASTPPRP